jgi:small GTP-binding protein
MEEFDTLIKAVVIGESVVGKTNLILRYTEDRYEEDMKNTIGVDLKTQIVKIAAKTIKVQFYDTAGQERFRALTPSNFHKADIAILVYDIANRESFDRLIEWYHLVQAHAPAQINLLFIGNKSDLEINRQVTKEEGARLAKEHDGFFFETSAKTNMDGNVNKAFHSIIEKTGAELLKDEEINYEIEKKMTRASTVTLKVLEDHRNQKGWCC